MKHHYLELQEGDRVIKRIPTSFKTEPTDRQSLQKQQRLNQEIRFIISSEPEKVIN
jgi:hypothetical protein